MKATIEFVFVVVVVGWLAHSFSCQTQLQLRLRGGCDDSVFLFVFLTALINYSMLSLKGPYCKFVAFKSKRGSVMNRALSQAHARPDYCKIQENVRLSIKLSQVPNLSLFHDK